MADALISPAVGGAMWAATAATTVYCAKKVREENDPAKVPLMGVAGAFIFAAQMLNFTIPGTGSSGHLGGGIILALLLGPEAGFLVMASVLMVQALFFADGGLLSLGANIFNLGFFPLFIAFPLIYRRIAGDDPGRARVVTGSMIAAVVGLQLGAFGVVLETTFSHISSLPFSTFVLMMQPIHLAIGIVEGLVTAGVALFVMRAQPELLARSSSARSLSGVNLKPVLISLTIAAVLAGGAFSWFASTNADGLEWSIARVTGSSEIAHRADGVHSLLASIQEKTAFLPRYGFKKPAEAEAEGAAPWPAADGGKSTSGIVGAGIVLVLAGGVGVVLKLRADSRAKRKRAQAA